MRGRRWSGYRVSLSKEFHITKDSIIRGMKGLRKLNIIEIEYPDYSGEFPFQEKEPTSSSSALTNFNNKSKLSTKSLPHVLAL